MIARLRDCLRLMGGEWVLSIVTRENPGKLIDKLKDTDVNVEIKKAERGSLQAGYPGRWRV